MTDDVFAIIGTGKMGTGMGLLLNEAGKKVAAVADLNSACAEKVAQLLGCRAYKVLSEAAGEANFILITTPDDAIEQACRMIVADHGIRPGSKVVHLSGAGGLDLLLPAAQAGAQTACIHPIQSLADAQSVLERIPGSTFGITTAKENESWAVRFVEDIGGTPLLVAEQDRPLYHAAACMASNYLVTLMHLVQTIYMQFGPDKLQAQKAFWPLVKGTIANMEEKGIAESLTGPIARGDVGTVIKHLETLEAALPSDLPVYRVLGNLTADLAYRNGTLKQDQFIQLKSILKGDCHE